MKEKQFTQSDLDLIIETKQKLLSLYENQLISFDAFNESYGHLNNAFDKVYSQLNKK